MNKNLKIEDKLRSSGLRPTKQRVQIAKFLFLREKTFHFTVEDLVHAFKKAGHLKEILTKNNKSYFDTHTGPHYHFFDVKNNELTDINPKEIQLKYVPKAPKGKLVKDIDVVINIENDS